MIIDHLKNYYGYRTYIKRELKEELGVRGEDICKIAVISDYYNPIYRHICITCRNKRCVSKQGAQGTHETAYMVAGNIL